MTVQGPQCLPLERRLMANLQNVGARNVGVITMSDEWNGISMAREDSRSGVGSPGLARTISPARGRGRSGISVRLITLLSATVALGIVACTSEETLTEPSSGPSPAARSFGVLIPQST